MRRGGSRVLMPGAPFAQVARSALAGDQWNGAQHPLVAGPLRLSLAQYRELEAFAQFGSELDQATLRQLARGQRVVEVLKQPQYQPMGVAEQTEVIFAVTNGLLDDVPVAGIRAWEDGFHQFMAASHPEMAEEIRTKKAISDDLAARLRQAIETYRALHK